jgi:hypothetical protein
MKSAPEKVAPKTKATPKNRGGGGAKDKGPSLLGRVTAVGPVSAVPAAANDAATAANDAAAADDDGNDIVEIIVPARTAVAATPPRNDELLHRRYRTRTKIGRISGEVDPRSRDCWRRPRRTRRRTSPTTRRASFTWS